MIFGLDNSGKTSIVYCLQRKTKISNFTTLSPTRDFNVIIFIDSSTNQEFAIWDFGGQEVHRKVHLNKLLSDYIANANKIIYVIDIQDAERYDASLEYLKNITQELEKEKIILSMTVFLHKFDPDFEIDDTELKQLVGKIKNIIPKNYKLEISKSTINAVFQKSPIL